MVCNTIREIIVHAAQEFGEEDAVRYKIKKDEVEEETITEVLNEISNMKFRIPSATYLGKSKSKFLVHCFLYDSARVESRLI